MSDAALVTGGTKRIGLAICERLAADGYHVVVHGRDLEEAMAVAERLGGSAIDGDLLESGIPGGLLARAEAAASRPITAVVNNASTFALKGWGQADYEDLDAMMRLHAWAPFSICRAAAAAGVEAAVNLLDTRITAQDRKHGPYLLAKKALAALTETMALELAPMRINGVAPGPILEPTDGSGDAMDAAIDATVAGRAGTPAEVADAVAFLLGNRYVTGEIIRVDGGRHLR